MKSLALSIFMYQWLDSTRKTLLHKSRYFNSICKLYLWLA